MIYEGIGRTSRFVSSVSTHMKVNENPETGLTIVAEANNYKFIWKRLVEFTFIVYYVG